MLSDDAYVREPITDPVDFELTANFEALLPSPTDRRDERALLGVAGAAAQADDAVGAFVELAVVLRPGNVLPAVTFAVERLREDLRVLPVVLLRHLRDAERSLASLVMSFHSRFREVT